MTDDDKFPEPEELDFSRESVQKLYFTGEARTINPERWERALKEVLFEDVILEMTGKHGNSISCPFHGRDSRPSFYIYRRGNDGWCFGCPPPAKNQYYNSIIFVARMLGCTRVQALRWIERKFNLPPLADVLAESLDEEVISEVTFEDLVEPYILLAAKEVQSSQDQLIAEEYLNIFFKAEALAGKEASQEDKAKAALCLAEVVGRDVIQRIKHRKAY